MSSLFSTPCPASNEIINKNFSLHILPLAKFWPWKIKSSSVNFFLKKDSFSSEIIFVLLIWKFLQTRWEFHLGAKRGHIVENLKITVKLRRKWSALQNHHAALILSFISDLTLLPTSMAPPSLLTCYTTASNDGKHWASEIVKN